MGLKQLFASFIAPWATFADGSARTRTIVQAGAILALAVGAPASWGRGPLAQRDQLDRLGLERPWFAQVPVDPQQSRISRWAFYRDRLFAVSTSGLLSAIDAESGATLWTSRVGKPGYPAFGPGANLDIVTAVSGSRLYGFDRDDGRLLWTRELGSAPASGPAVTKDHAFVALLNGQIESYSLEDPTAQPWYYQSKGRTYQRPTVTGPVVSWPTAGGLLYVCSAEDPHVLYRLETNDEIIAPPAELSPNLYVGSFDGYLYCIDELSGRERWRFSAGYPIANTPAVIGDVAYVASTKPALHAVSTETGRELWQASGVERFAACGKASVYAQGVSGSLIVLD
ncbi:MAG: PQQ-like beta-propeller repeat protein, partial [Planctomycetales bacterium]|nr:PQQ-like beta-propeller repeat protein [Planctomycetales bacterium]